MLIRDPLDRLVSHINDDLRGNKVTTPQEYAMKKRNVMLLMLKALFDKGPMWRLSEYGSNLRNGLLLSLCIPL